MRTLALLLGLATTGCLGSVVPDHLTGDDLAAPKGPDIGLPGPMDSGNSGGDMHGGSMGGNDMHGGGMGGGDMHAGPTAPDGGAPLDAAGGQAAFGGTCSTDGDCQSGMCRAFAQGTIKRCTIACTYVNQNDPAPECPKPPSAGLCTNNGYCKFTN